MLEGMESGFEGILTERAIRRASAILGDFVLENVTWVCR